MGQLTVARVQCDLPFVKAYKDRHGRWRYYFRRRGRKPTALPGAPGSPEFLTAYQNAAGGERPPVTAPPGKVGSFDALCREFTASAEFTQLAESTKREAGYVIEALRKEHGDKPVNRLERKHILGWKNTLKHKPGACNKMLRTVKMILSYAVLAEYRTDNPAEKIKLMKLGRWRSWKDQEVAAFEARWPVGTVERMIFDLALYTGQRRADLASMRRDQISGKYISLRQQKTGKDMALRIHTNLAASLDAFLPTHKAETIIAGPAGTPLAPVYMAAIFRDACRTAGMPEECVLHGLRKTVARILAEIGSKSTPVTGHMTRAMQDEYERDADQKKMGTDAIAKWERSARKRRA